MNYQDFIRLLCSYCENDIPMNINSFFNTIKNLELKILNYEYMKYEEEGFIPLFRQYTIKPINKDFTAIKLVDISVINVIDKNDPTKNNMNTVICSQIDKYNIKIIAVSVYLCTQDCIAVNPNYEEYTKPRKK